MFNISLDLSAVLIVAVISGYVMIATHLGNNTQYISNIQSHMKFFSSFGTAIFVSAIGLSAGYALKSNWRKEWIAAVIGALMVVAGNFSMKIIAVADNNMSDSGLLGILCGALTTTPGLSAVCERQGVVSEEAVLGYSSAYFFGVIFVVVFVQMITRNLERSFVLENDASKNGDAFLQICCTVILGNIVGGVQLPLINFSLGISGGVLCVGILIGYIIQKWFCSSKASVHSLSLLKNLGLVFFFVRTGIPAGMQLMNNFSIKLLLYGGVMTVVPILVGYLICIGILKKSRMETAQIIAGGMTSTPAIGVLLQNNKATPSAQYAFSYVGALLTIVMFL